MCSESNRTLFYYLIYLVSSPVNAVFPAVFPSQNNSGRLISKCPRMPMRNLFLRHQCCQNDTDFNGGDKKKSLDSGLESKTADGKNPDSRELYKSQSRPQKSWPTMLGQTVIPLTPQTNFLCWSACVVKLQHGSEVMSNIHIIIIDLFSPRHNKLYSLCLI